MEEQYEPGVFSIDATQKGDGTFKTTINIKDPDTHFFFHETDVEKIVAQIPDYTAYAEQNGEIIFIGWLDIRKKNILPIHDRMAIWSNLKRFSLTITHYSGTFDQPRSTGLLWLKTTGKNDSNYNNEYQFEGLNKQRCYKIARFLRASNYKFTPELNDYLFLRCGIKFDLDLMDVDIVAFHDLKGQVFLAP